MLPTPGISTGYWKARKMPWAARSSGASASRSFPSYSTWPLVTSKVSRPASTCDSVLLPEPLGPMMACTSPGRTTRSMPLRISFSPTRACSPRISSIGALGMVTRRSPPGSR